MQIRGREDLENLMEICTKINHKIIFINKRDFNTIIKDYPNLNKFTITNFLKNDLNNYLTDDKIEELKNNYLIFETEKAENQFFTFLEFLIPTFFAADFNQTIQFKIWMVEKYPALINAIDTKNIEVNHFIKKIMKTLLETYISNNYRIYEYSIKSYYRSRILNFEKDKIFDENFKKNLSISPTIIEFLQNFQKSFNEIISNKNSADFLKLNIVYYSMFQQYFVEDAFKAQKINTNTGLFDKNSTERVIDDFIKALNFFLQHNAIKLSQ
jgi:hypothetical protein